MTNQVRLSDFLQSADNLPLELVRLDSNETAVVPFTDEGERTDVHYCSEDEITGYLRCNGPDCLLCRAGRKKEERVLIPVYLPTAGVVGVLPVSTSLRPLSLLPQLAEVVKSGKPMVAFITRDRGKFHVSPSELSPDADSGEAAVQSFREKHEKGEVKLSSVYQQLPNEELARVPGIARMLELKGMK